MNSQKKFKKIYILLSNKKNYSTLNIEDITDSHYKHAKKACGIKKLKKIKKYKIKNLGECYDFLVQSDKVLLAAARFKRNELDPAYFLSAPALHD